MAVVARFVRVGLAGVVQREGVIAVVHVAVEQREIQRNIVAGLPLELAAGGEFVDVIGGAVEVDGSGLFHLELLAVDFQQTLVEPFPDQGVDRRVVQPVGFVVAAAPVTSAGGFM